MTQDRIVLKAMVLCAVFLPVWFCAGCDSGGNKDLPKKITRELTREGIDLWEDEVTETSGGTVLGHILRGKTNLRINGSFATEDIRSFERGMNLAEQKKRRLFRFDFSDALLTQTALTEEASLPSPPLQILTSMVETPDPAELRPEVFKLNSFRLGAVSLPPGIADVRIGLEGGTPYLLDVDLPPAGLGSARLSITGAFTRILVPADAGLIQLRSSNEFVAILAEGRTTIEFITGTGSAVDTGNYIGLSENPWMGGWSRKKPSFTLVIPSTLEEFTGRLPGCEEIYSYASLPPRALDQQEYRFPDLKTVYVPAGTEESYEEAWFNETSATFMPLPSSKESIGAFYPLQD